MKTVFVETVPMLPSKQLTRTTHAYDTLRHAKRHVQMGHTAQVSDVARLVGVQRTMQNNGNVKNLQYVLSTFEQFLVLLSLSWLLFNSLNAAAILRHC